MIKIDLNLYSKLASVATRRESARLLAQELGAEDLIIFDWDDEVSRFLPSTGFPQTIKGGQVWSEFLSACAKTDGCKGELPFPPSNEASKVIAKKFSDNSIWVFLAEELTMVKISTDMKLLAANFDIILKNERRARKYEGQNQTLSELTHELRTYAEALNLAKCDLNHALQEAEKAKCIAENANATKSAFLANMSHEIRTPLGVILGYSALLRENDLSTEDRKKYIDVINRNGRSLTRIIDDILDLAKVESGRVEIETVAFSLFALMTEVVEIFSEKAKQKNIYLILNINESVPDHICSDPTRLRQILINMVGNAVKFTTQGGVKVNVKSHQEHHQAPLSIKVEVKDTGPGLSEEQKGRLFQPFMQADNSTTRQFGGTGLGLALSKRLSEILGGTITLEECALQKGCTFTVEFTASIPELAISENKEITTNMPSNEKELALKGVKVLLVDDSEDNQFLVKHLLTENGALVETADNGASAVTAALDKTFDIVLMDIQMPIMDGYDAMKMLLEKGYTTPVVALTAHAMTEDRMKATAGGFTDHVTKPIDVPNLLLIIQKYTRDLNPRFPS